jgi:hypothetical protein
VRRRNGYLLPTLAAGLLLGGIGLIVLGIGGQRQAAAFASTPITPVEQLENVTGTGTRVRVEAVVAGSPDMVAPNGEQLALEMVKVEHTERNRNSSNNNSTRTVTDYERTVPERMLASDGTGEILVETEWADPALLPQLAGGKTRDDGSPPLEIASWLLPDFQAIPRRRDATISVWGLRAGERVTIYGVVERKQGQLVLRSPADNNQSFFVISSLSPEEIVAKARRGNTITVAMGVVMGLVGFGLGLWLARRAPRR